MPITLTSNGTTTNTASPVQVGIATTWSAVAAGSNFTVALRSDGTLRRLQTKWLGIYEKIPTIQP